MPEDSLKKVGIERDPSKRSASFLMVDDKPTISFARNVEVMSTKQALEKYEWLKDYSWKLIEREEGEFDGYFIRVPKGVKVDFPVEACLYLKRVKSQKVHNIVIAEEDSELNLITGCTSERLSGLHLGISEFYVKRNAKVTFTMIHNWKKKNEVLPKTAIKVEENGTFISNYVLLSPVKYLKAYPTAYLDKNAKVVFSSVIVGFEDSEIDLGSRVYLNGEGSSAEIISRSISKGGKIVARGHIIGNAEGVKGHLECKGMILGGGIIHAIPELEARNPNVDLSHEAAIGKIAEDEIFYLMTRGLSRDEAISLIIRGFMEIDIKGLPEVLKKEIDKAIELVEKALI
ncbi:SufB/SufD family protein [Archaeoglobus profundus]|uniref:SufBD protein n=1 Tax=Archaeoglobus profundus (strain DSM 5631 / JCM 9629 / NBRC 100127 / Av18) TaxID=572546 RepID=D2RGK9_ARCPA|nr:SufD family Fe-S cluster assembly protein [Archaeoglobus profundus]ADB57434.1 SufBD protein [Archaeoglobus profundus DSM 5631]